MADQFQTLILYSVYSNLIYIPLAQLLTNYRCHDSILRLPSNLFFGSTLHVRTNSKLHPKTSSALVFVCTSMDRAITTSSQDFSRDEARTTLEQVGCVSFMINQHKAPWPLYRCSTMLTLGQL